MPTLDHIKVVLVATTHPGNIGATARAMKTMGLHHLYLVSPKIFPHVDATARAAGADDILANITVVNDLSSALSDCQLIIGTSVRPRDLPLKLLNAREAATKIVVEANQKHQVAIVFGRESNGLSNEELLQCHDHLYIPANPEFSSLNLAAAVQIVAYEIMMAHHIYQLSPTAPNKTYNAHDIYHHDNLATTTDMKLFYEHLEKVLTAIEFLKPRKSKKLILRLQRLFNRARLERLEVNILRGILSAIEKKLNVITFQRHDIE